MVLSYCLVLFNSESFCTVCMGNPFVGLKGQLQSTLTSLVSTTRLGPWLLPLATPQKINLLWCISGPTAWRLTARTHTHTHTHTRAHSTRVEDYLFPSICRHYSSEKKKALAHPKWLSNTCTYRLFIIFNELLGDSLGVQISGKCVLCACACACF